ncbi:MAG: T9SS type A sorting domain-containing protein [Flavobacteriales bacterium]|nr:T9SS type A sorting domain-containing protein [Flavobacteriales bacterium]
MSKFYTLFIFFFTVVAYSQNLTVNGGMESWTAGALDTWTSESGTTIEQETSIKAEGNSSAKFTVTTQSQGDTDFRQTVSVEAGKIYTVSFKVFLTDNESEARLYAGTYQNVYSDETKLNEWQTLSYDYSAAATGNVEFGIRFYDIPSNWTGAGSVMYIDDFVVEEQGAVPYTSVTNLAELRADVATNGTGGNYVITGEVVVSYIVQDAGTGIGGRNQKYVQDANAGILIDDSNGTITSSLVEGDGIINLKGQVSEYNGVLQLIPSENATASSSGTSLAPIVVSISDFLANGEMYESRLIQFDNASFTDAGSTIASDTNYNLSSDGSTVTVRTSFDASDYIGQTLPTSTTNVTAIGAEFNGNYQVYPRFLSDLQNLSIDTLSSFNEEVYISNTVVLDSFAVYTNGNFNVRVYNLNGILVNTSKGTNSLTIPTSTWHKGVYIVKISNSQNQTSTKKIIKQ